MSLVLGRLYIALRAAEGIGIDRAEEAAKEVTDIESRLSVLEIQLRLITWLVRVNLLLTFILLGLLLIGRRS